MAKKKGLFSWFGKKSVADKTEESVEDTKAALLKSINDEAEMRRLIEQGCDGIITDYPELLMSIINEVEE